MGSWVDCTDELTEALRGLSLWQRHSWGYNGARPGPVEKKKETQNHDGQQWLLPNHLCSVGRTSPSQGLPRMGQDDDENYCH